MKTFLGSLLTLYFEEALFRMTITLLSLEKMKNKDDKQNRLD